MPGYDTTVPRAERGLGRRAKGTTGVEDPYPFEERLIARIGRGLGISEEAVAAIGKRSSEGMDSREVEPRG